MGFVSNLFGATNNYSTANDNGASAYGNAKPLAAGVDYTNMGAKALQDQINGTGPNPALAQFNKTANQNANSAAGLISSQRGLNPALATKLASDAYTASNNEAAANAAILKAQQQQAAAGQLGQLGLSQQQTFNQANLGAQAINAGVNAQNANTNGQIIGGILGGGSQAGAAALTPAAAAAAHGGMIRKMADGGDVLSPDAPTFGSSLTPMAPSLGVTGVAPTPIATAPALGNSPSDSPSAFSQALTAGAKGAKSGAQAMGSGPNFYQQFEAGLRNPMYAKGGMTDTGDKLKSGGKVPGKAKVPGDSLKNDTVKAQLSPGEIVIPRSVINSEDPTGNGAKFIAAVLARGGHLPARKSA